MSQASFDAASQRWETLMAATDGDLKAMALDMISIVDVLSENSQVRRILTDPAGDGDAKAGLVEAIFGGKVHPDVLDFVKGAARAHWSAEDDFVETIGRHAAITVLADAERLGILADVADEMFAVEQFLTKERALRAAFADKLQRPEDRVALVDRVFGTQVHEHTLMLLRRMVTSERHHGGVITSLRAHTELAAQRRDRVLAVVTAALPLTAAQIERVNRILQARYGKEVQVHVRLDPDIVGGMRITVGDDVVDGTLQSRLATLERQLTD